VKILSELNILKHNYKISSKKKKTTTKISITFGEDKILN